MAVKHDTWSWAAESSDELELTSDEVDDLSLVEVRVLLAELNEVRLNQEWTFRSGVLYGVLCRREAELLARR